MPGEDQPGLRIEAGAHWWRDSMTRYRCRGSCFVPKPDVRALREELEQMLWSPQFVSIDKR